MLRSILLRTLLFVVLRLLWSMFMAASCALKMLKVQSVNKQALFRIIQTGH